MSADWKQVPLGIAVIDETANGDVAVHHVAVDAEGVRLSGIWMLVDPSARELADRLAHWVIVGTRDGVQRAEEILGEPVGSADLSGLVEACVQATDELESTWQAHKDAEPKKRTNLVPLNAPMWPKVSEDGDAARILTAIGRAPYATNTPDDARDVLALANLVRYVAQSWWELEAERTGRAYLNDGTPRQLLPPRWIESNPCWWPSGVLA